MAEAQQALTKHIRELLKQKSRNDPVRSIERISCFLHCGNITCQEKPEKIGGSSYIGGREGWNSRNSSEVLEMRGVTSHVALRIE